jgi:hypothetical protein
MGGEKAFWARLYLDSGEYEPGERREEGKWEPAGLFSAIFIGI